MSRAARHVREAIKLFDRTEDQGGNVDAERHELYEALKALIEQVDGLERKLEQCQRDIHHIQVHKK